MNVTDTLNERGSRYGDFSEHAIISQALKRVVDEHGGSSLEAYQRESLEMIFHKIGRILNGDPNYDDSWHDIAGYATLVVDHLHSKGAKDEHRIKSS